MSKEELESYMDELIETGKKEPPIINIDFRIRFYHIYRILLIKHRYHCNDLHLKYNVATKKINDDNEFGEKFLEKLKKCLEEENKPVLIYFDLKNCNSEGGGHANLIMIKNNQIFKFEPHGNLFKSDQTITNDINECVKKLAKTISSDKNTYTFIPQRFNHSGFQALLSELEYGEVPGEIEQGSCVLWTMFMCDISLEFPNIPFQMLYGTAYKKLIGKSKKLEENTFLYFIRGYYKSIKTIIDKNLSLSEISNPFILSLVKKINIFGKQKHDMMHDMMKHLTIRILSTNHILT